MYILQRNMWQLKVKELPLYCWRDLGCQGYQHTVWLEIVLWYHNTTKYLIMMIFNVIRLRVILGYIKSSRSKNSLAKVFLYAGIWLHNIPQRTSKKCSFCLRPRFWKNRHVSALRCRIYQQSVLIRSDTDFSCLKGISRLYVKWITRNWSAKKKT